MTLTFRLIEWCRDAMPRIEEDALAGARRCLVDSIAAAFTALNQLPINTLLRLHKDDVRENGSAVIGHAVRMPGEVAALINGTMISLQMFDDSNEEMRGHPSAPVWPAVLAIAERKDKNLREALSAFVVGYEVECLLGGVLNPSHYELGWHATATQGTVASAVVSSLLLGLEASQTAHALGIAASMAGGLRRNFGTMTMSLHSGIAASNGLRAAILAAEGFTADTSILDGAMSFGEAFSHEWTPAGLSARLDRLGDPFAIIRPGPTFKLFPSGRPTVAPIECTIAMQEKHALEPRNVKSVTCDVSYMYPRTLIHHLPQTGLQGKTSLQYCIATTLLDRRPTLKSFTDNAVRRPEIADLIAKIKVRVPPSLSEDVPEVRRAPFEQPVTVTIETTSGQLFSDTVRYPKGSPQNPILDEDLAKKFEDCASAHLSAPAVNAVLRSVYDDAGAVRGLLALLAGETRH